MKIVQNVVANLGVTFTNAVNMLKTRLKTQSVY